jgi:anaphase-promoting complex subunit 5
MEEPEPPPTAHTLRPHHISILMVIMLLYRHYPRKRFHPSFLIRVHRILLQEIVEVGHLMDSVVSLNPVSR